MNITYRHFRCIQDPTKRPRCKGKPSKKMLLRYLKSENGFEAWPRELGGRPATKGGLTLCTITTGDGDQYTGVALCSLSENFSYKEGRDKARSRAELAMWAAGSIA